ncbi:hypothetical protein T492DRAFT_141889 [Pavlovales sp. CCMP2436]|nr:hypothetical protein T492DRAFT_141889 [Pavlovales sp. CCMP2436]
MRAFVAFFVLQHAAATGLAGAPAMGRLRQRGLALKSARRATIATPPACALSSTSSTSYTSRTLFRSSVRELAAARSPASVQRREGALQEGRTRSGSTRWTSDKPEFVLINTASTT